MAAEALPKFTVIIPTRARADVLPAALRTVVAQDYDNLEILVSDNFSEDGTADIVQALNDPRIRYLNTGRRLSMSHNWEFALSHVEDGWVSILGDDDGLMPGAIAKVAELAATSGALAVRSSTCKYRWPSRDGKGARLSAPTQRGVELRDSRIWLQRALDGQAGYMDLPMLYTGGFADMRLMFAIRARMGAFYSSCVPDVYSGVAIASIADRYLYSYAPLAIAGISRHSTGTAHFSRPKIGAELSPAKLFISEGNIPFHSDIPVCSDGITPRSPQVTLLESFLQSAALRGPAPHDLYARQLAIVAATCAPNDADLAQWMEDFATLHGLDLNNVSKSNMLRRLLNRISEMPKKNWRRFKTTKLRAPQYEINDVYLASLAVQRRLEGG